MSARAATWATVSTLTPEVEVALRGEVRGRWKFIFATTAQRPMGNLPVLAQQEETYGSSAYDLLTLACATRLRVKNKGTALWPLECCVRIRPPAGPRAATSFHGALLWYREVGHSSYTN